MYGNQCNLCHCHLPTCAYPAYQISHVLTQHTHSAETGRSARRRTPVRTSRHRRRAGAPGHPAAARRHRTACRNKSGRPAPASQGATAMITSAIGQIISSRLPSWRSVPFSFEPGCLGPGGPRRRPDAARCTADASSWPCPMALRRPWPPPAGRAGSGPGPRHNPRRCAVSMSLPPAFSATTSSISWCRSFVDGDMAPHRCGGSDGASAG